MNRPKIPNVLINTETTGIPTSKEILIIYHWAKKNGLCPDCFLKYGYEIETAPVVIPGVASCDNCYNCGWTGI